MIIIGIGSNGKSNYILLSCAKTEDRSVIVWEPEQEETGIWVETARLGEVGGNREGFFSSKFLCDANIIISVSYQV